MCVYGPNSTMAEFRIEYYSPQAKPFYTRPMQMISCKFMNKLQRKIESSSFVKENNKTFLV